jgi:putative sigma-54 modulation protein
MNIQVQSIHFKADQKLVSYIETRLEKLNTFYDRIIGAEVFLKLENNEEKANKIVQVKLQIPGNDIVVSDQRSTFEEAADHAYDVLKTKLSKIKEKSLSH